MEKKVNVVQVGNIVDDTNIGFKNPQRGRVYSVYGIAPSIYCFQGGNLQPKIIIYEREDNNIREVEYKRIAQKGL